VVISIFQFITLVKAKIVIPEKTTMLSRHAQKSDSRIIIVMKKAHSFKRTRWK